LAERPLRCHAIRDAGPAARRTDDHAHVQHRRVLELFL
jgi:hypothetical protein